ncbi:MAG: PD-(D/E)XK nuclease family protein [Xanthomonadales bacterium]|nr:PD-(D/E)XK nuclease family protein [Xanthomonadales bacterium]
MDIPDLLDKVSRETDVLREARCRFADKLAPDFRLFDYLRNDEYGLSRCIADLLNPKGPHGQGDQFLQQFLKIENLPEWANPHELKDVTTEWLTENKRRIDIFLEFEHGCIGVENKPWAGDGENQLSDYADSLGKLSRGRNWYLIFLSNREPAEESIKRDRWEELTKESKAARIDFRQIERWLEACFGRIKAYHVRVFVEELTKYVRHEINGELEMSEQDQVVRQVLESPKTLESAFDITASWPAVRAELITRFKAQLDVRIRKAFPQAEKPIYWDRIEEGKAHRGFGIWFGPGQDKLLYYSFDAANYGQFYWGICGESAKIPLKDEQTGPIRELMISFTGRPGKTYGPTWIWWDWMKENDFDLGPGINDWSVHAGPWIGMIHDENENSLAAKFTQMAMNVAKAFETKMDLLKPLR